MSKPSPWLRGPVDGIPRELMPIAHALIDAREEVESALEGLNAAELGSMPGGAASLSFHARHIAGSIDRLLTYARGDQLDDGQRAAIVREKEQTATSADELTAGVSAAVEAALTALRAVRADEMHETREVGAARLPSTVFDILHHVADHAQRHVGQLVATAKIIRGSRA